MTGTRSAAHNSTIFQIRCCSPSEISGRKEKLTAKGLSVSSRISFSSFWKASTVGKQEILIVPSPPALLTQEANLATPRCCIPPCMIGCWIPNSCVILVFNILFPLIAAVAWMLALERCSPVPVPLSRGGGIRRGAAEGRCVLTRKGQESMPARCLA